MDEVPDRAVVDLQPALGQFDHQAAQGEVPLPTAPDKPVVMLVPDRLGLCPPIWPGEALPVSRNRRTQPIAVLGATP
jgi:hypothetical protein